MKLIFLDIDGVLVTERTLDQRRALGARHRFIVNSECVRSLNMITSATGAHIVLSSAWRFCGWREMRLILEAWGVEGEILDLTPDLTEVHDGTCYPVPRDQEIERFLRDFESSLRGEIVHSYVILDDDCKGLQNPLIRARLIKTRFEEGLRPEHAVTAIRLLNGT